MIARLPIPTGLTWNSRKTPRFSTVTQYPVSGARPVSFSTSPFPSWEWELTWEFLRDQGLDTVNSISSAQPEFSQLQDFFLAMNGSNGRFIYDPAANSIPIEDNFVTQNLSGTMVNGYSGSTEYGQTAYQLYRSSKVTGSLVEVEAIDALSAVCQPFSATPFHLYLDNVLVDPSTYTLGDYPLVVTFGSAPAVGKTITWTGVYAYIAKFGEDKIDLSQFMYRLWELQSMKIEQVPLGF